MQSEWEKLSLNEIQQIIADFRITCIRATSNKSALIKKLTDMDISPFFHQPLLRVETSTGWIPKCFAYTSPYLYVGEAKGLFRAEESTIHQPRQRITLQNIECIQVHIASKRSKIPSMLFYLTKAGRIFCLPLAQARDTKVILDDDKIKHYSQFSQLERFAYDAKHHSLVVQEMATSVEEKEEESDRPMQRLVLQFRTEKKKKSVKSIKERQQEQARKDAIRIDNGTLVTLDLHTETTQTIKLDQDLIGVNGMVVDRRGVLYLTDTEACRIYAFERTAKQDDASKPTVKKQKAITTAAATPKTAELPSDVMQYSCIEIIGNGSSAPFDGNYAQCGFSSPTFITVDDRDNWYVFDNENTTIRKGNSLYKKVTTIFIGPNVPLTLPTNGISFTVTDTYNLFVLDTSGTFQEYSPYDEHIVYPLASIYQSHSVFTHWPVALLVLEYFLCINYKMYYPEMVLRSLADKMTAKWMIQDKTEQYIAKQSGSHWITKSQPEQTSQVSKLFEKCEKCSDEKRDHIPAKSMADQRAELAANSSKVALREWERHTDLYKAQAIERFCEQERQHDVVFDKWIVKYHDELCCVHRHENHMAMLKGPNILGSSKITKLQNSYEKKRREFLLSGTTANRYHEPGSVSSSSDLI